MKAVKMISMLAAYFVLKGAFAAGGSYVVDDLGDAGDAAIDGVCATAAGTCTLRAALEEANASAGAKEIIFFDDLLGPVELAEPLPLVGDSVEIRGNGPSRTVIDANGTGSIFGIYTSTNDQEVFIEGLRLTGGVSHVDVGGAIWVDEGDALKLSDCLVDGNRAEQGGGIYVDSGAVVTVRNSTFSENQAQASGMGIGGAIVNYGALRVVNGTFSGNESDTGGGAIHNGSEGEVAIVSSTLFFNSSAGASSIYNVTGGTAAIRNTILVDESPLTPYNCAGAVVSEGVNLSNDYVCFDGPEDIIAAEPLVDPFLRDRGGPTPAHALLEGSPAIDAIDPADCTNLSGGLLGGDQRGFVRPGDGDGDGLAACDIGAFEIVCGDGIRQSFAGEECDEGNVSVPRCDYGQTSCLVCAPDCTHQQGETEYCGNGVLFGEAGEECDDGNNADGDGCAADCRIETSEGTGGGTTGGTGGGTAGGTTGGASGETAGGGTGSVSDAGGGCSLIRRSTPLRPFRAVIRACKEASTRGDV